MPTTKTGAKIKAAMRAEYGTKKGKQVYFASIVKSKPGSSKWEGKKKGGTLQKAKRTYAKKRRENK